MSRKLKNTLAKRIINVTDENIDDEEFIHALLEEDFFVTEDTPATFGERAADALAKFAGSWLFIILFSIFLAVWICLNLLFLLKPFDPYPFILLNLILSCIASVQAPLIMMSQNRQEAKDRRRSESAYKVNLKTEIIIEDMHYKLDKIISLQQQLLKKAENNVTGVEKD